MQLLLRREENDAVEMKWTLFIAAKNEFETC